MVSEFFGKSGLLNLNWWYYIHTVTINHKVIYKIKGILHPWTIGFGLDALYSNMVLEGGLLPTCQAQRPHRFHVNQYNHSTYMTVCVETSATRAPGGVLRQQPQPLHVTQSNNLRVWTGLLPTCHTGATSPNIINPLFGSKLQDKWGGVWD